MAQMTKEQALFKRIYARQWEERWHDQYDAAIHATKGEAPRLSQATILAPEKVGGRAFHCLSNQETWAALLALYHTRVWEIHEQRILYPNAREHPLARHPRGAGRVWPPLRGVLDVAERLGYMGYIRVIRVQKGERWVRVPKFWIGDQLLYIEDDAGPYLVNWSVKKETASFGTPGPSRTGKMPSKRSIDRARARHEIELAYFADAEIRTQEVPGDEIDVNLRCNLRDLFLRHSLPVPVAEPVRERAVQLFANAVGTGEPANFLVRAVAAALGTSSWDSETILRQAIWRREVRIDLFRPFHMDKPLRAERVDPLVRYASWFAR